MRVLFCRSGGRPARTIVPAARIGPPRPAPSQAQARAATAAAEAVLAEATQKVRERVTIEGRTVARMLDREQRAAHGLSWLATYVESVRQLTAYAERMQEAGTFGETEELIVRIGIGEYLSQIVGGIPISQNEIVRPSDFGLSLAHVAQRMASPQVEALIASGMTALEAAATAEEQMRLQSEIDAWRNLLLESTTTTVAH